MRLHEIFAYYYVGDYFCRLLDYLLYWLVVEGARDQEGRPDVCADDGGLQPHPIAQPGANPPAGAAVREKVQEIGRGKAKEANQEQ